MTAAEPRPWGEALVWALFLGVFFFGTYGWANAFTATRPHIGTVIWAWEQYIPFLPWTIVPYWSLDLAYASSIFLCPDRATLRRHGARLLLAQAIALGGFLLFPLRVGFQRPAVEGIPGHFFRALGAFDLPFNQAPSLHIILLVVLWSFLAPLVPRRGRWFLHAWALLVGVSVLTTWQHQAVDVVTGAAVGVLCLCAFPGALRFQKPSRKEVRIGLFYLVGSLLALLAATTLGGWLGGWAWLLAWPALACLLVAGGYFGLGPGVFGPTPAPWYWRLLMLPVRAGATASARLLARGRPPFTEVAPGLWIGRAPTRSEALSMGIQTVVNLSPEVIPPPLRPQFQPLSAPLLDLATPTAAEWSGAVETVVKARAEGSVLVHCALGLQRSALVAAALLAREGHSPAEAWAHIGAQRPGARAFPGQLRRLGVA